MALGVHDDPGYLAAQARNALGLPFPMSAGGLSGRAGRREHKHRGQDVLPHLLMTITRMMTMTAHWDMYMSMQLPRLYVEVAVANMHAPLLPKSS